MLEFGTDRLHLSLHGPEDGFYRGTRFDHGGIFDSVRLDGTEFCGRWFDRYDPFLHDAVCGPAEEFSLISLPSGESLKIGVGLLDVGPEAYDRFRLYPVVDAGEWTVEEHLGKVFFQHRLNGYYTYKKSVVLTGNQSFCIDHVLEVGQPLETEVYNHNFFTLGRLEIGPEREIDFPFVPDGHWRAVYDSVAFYGRGIRFNRFLKEGESVYAGDIHQQAGPGMPYEMTLREGLLAVHISGSIPVTRTVLWANHRVACLEPYNTLSLRPGNPFRWQVNYRLEDGRETEKIDR
jgi:hypothetical protein